MSVTHKIYQGLMERFQITNARVDGDVLQTAEGLIVRSRNGFVVYAWPEATKAAVTAFLEGALVGLRSIRARPNNGR